MQADRFVQDRIMIARKKSAQLLGREAGAHAQQLAVSNNMTARRKRVAYQDPEVSKDQLLLLEATDAIEFYPEKEASPLSLSSHSPLPIPSPSPSPLPIPSPLYDKYDSSTPSGCLVEKIRAFSSFTDRVVQDRVVQAGRSKIESCTEVES